MKNVTEVQVNQHIWCNPTPITKYLMDTKSTPITKYLMDTKSTNEICSHGIIELGSHGGLGE